MQKNRKKFTSSSSTPHTHTHTRPQLDKELAILGLERRNVRGQIRHIVHRRPFALLQLFDARRQDLAELFLLGGGVRLRPVSRSDAQMMGENNQT